MNCEFCAANDLALESEVREVPYKHGFISAEFPYFRCNACGEEFVTAAQGKQTDRTLADAKRVFDGLLPAEAIVRFRREIHLTQDQASIAFGGGPNSFYKYERGEVIQSKASDLLMRGAWECLPFRDWVLRQAGMQTTRRGCWEADDEMVLSDLSAPIGSTAVHDVFDEPTEHDWRPMRHQAA